MNQEAANSHKKYMTAKARKRRNKTQKAKLKQESNKLYFDFDSLCLLFNVFHVNVWLETNK